MIAIHVPYVDFDHQPDTSTLPQFSNMSDVAIISILNHVLTKCCALTTLDQINLTG